MPRRSVELVHFATKLDDCPTRPIPEVAFSGRSNVGKSSLINLLTFRKKLAYTSKQPGKTRLFTFYVIDDRWHLVDMPGYGYARVPPQERQRWQSEARRYFHGRKQLAAVIQLIDLKVGPTPDDRARLRELLGLGKPFCLVFTKADKVSRSRQERAVAEHLGLLGALPPETGVVLSSSLEKYGADELWAWIEDHLG